MDTQEMHTLFADTVAARGVDLWTERRPSGDYRYQTAGDHFKGFAMGFEEGIVHAVASMVPGNVSPADGVFREFVLLSLHRGGCNAAEIAQGWIDATPR